MNFTKYKELLHKGKYKEAIIYLENYDTDDRLILAKRDIQLSGIYIDLGEFGKAIDIITRVLDNDLPEHIEYEARIKLFEANIYQGDYNRLLKEVIILYNVISSNTENNILLLFHSLRLKIHLLTDLGMFNQLSGLINELLQLAEMINEDIISAMTYHQKARVNDFQGNFIQAEIDYKLAISFIDKYEFSFYISFPIHNLGIIYSFRGLFHKAIDCFDREIQIYRRINATYHVYTTEVEKAWVYFNMAETDKSMIIFRNAYNYLKSRKGDKDYVFLAEILTRMIVILTSDNKTEEAEKYLDELDSIKEFNNTERIKKYCDLSRATILKSNKRIRKRAEAMNLFEKVAFSTLIDIEFTIYSYISLAQLYVYDYSIANEKETLDEIEILISRLYKYAELQSSSSTNSQVRWLDAKIKLLKNEIEEAKELLAKAIIEAENTGFHYLAKQISDELDELEYNLEVSPDLINKSIYDIDLAEQILFNKKINIKEENGILVFIIGDAGLPLYSKIIDENIDINENLLSSFLNAINSFGMEALKTSNNIKRIQYHEFIILNEIYNNIHFCYVVKGHSYLARSKLTNFLNEYRRDFILNQIQSDTSSLDKEDAKRLDKLINKYF